MKKNTLQKMLAAVLTGAMAVSMLTACGGTEDAANDSAAVSTEAQSSEAAGDTAEASTEAADAVAGIDGWEPFAENVTLTIPVYDRGQEGVPAIGENYWETWIQENFGDAYNITLEFEPITRSDVLTSYSLLAASEDLPTILMEYDYPKLAQWAADGYLTTYDIDQFAQIAPTYYNRMVENDQIQYTEMNGERYFVLAERPYYNTNYTWVTMYRQDWLEQVGYDEYPTTWAEEKEMLQALVDAGICEHPYGGQMITGAGVDQNYAFRTYPQDELEWATYGDYAIPALGSDANREYIRRENEKYNLGYLDPEYYIIDLETAKANFVNGKTLLYSNYISADMDWVTAFYEQNPDGDLAVRISQNVVDEEAGTVPFAFRANNPFGMMIGFSSQASEDEIKAAMMYMEWMTLEDNLFTMQWGNEGEHYTLDENGLPVSVADYSGDKTQGYGNNKDYWCVTIEARNAGTIEDVIAMSSPKGIPEDFTQDIIDNYYAQVELYEAGYGVSDCNYSVVIESASEYQATLLSLYTEYRDQLTMCSPEEFDALYDQLAQQYADAGYQEILDERAAAYEAGSTTKLPE